MTKVALITGGSGQDGSYLIELLSAHNYTIHAHAFGRPPSADASHKGPDVTWHTGDLADRSTLEDVLRATQPDEIYNLAAVSRPGLSWDDPYGTTLLNALMPQQICEWLIKHRPDCRLFHASSSDVFGNSGEDKQTEDTPFRPASPYAMTKAFSQQIVGVYRDRFKLHASTGILFNHESPRRPLGYVSQKIAHAAAALSLGLRNTEELDERGLPIVRDGKLHLGDISIRRDFGFAGDIVRAMHMILQSDAPGNYIIGSGQSRSIAEFCELAFKTVELDWQQYVVVDQSLIRQNDTRFTTADTSKVRALIGWEPQLTFEKLVETMVQDRIASIRQAIRSP